LRFSGGRRLFKAFRAVTEGRQGHTTFLGGGGTGDCAGLPTVVRAGIIFRQGSGRAAETNPAGFGGSNPLFLPFTDIFAFTLGDKGKDLKDQVCNKGAHQVLAVAGIQKGHINDADINADFLGQDPPLILNFRVIAAQTVDAEDIEQVALPKPADKAFVLGAVEIFTGLFIHKDIMTRDGFFLQGNPLAVFILVRTGYAYIPIILHDCTSL